MIMQRLVTVTVCMFSILMHYFSAFISRGNILGGHNSITLVKHRNSIHERVDGYRKYHMSSKRNLMNYIQNNIEEPTLPNYTYQIKKAKKKDIKEISSLCVDTFFDSEGDLDDWLSISREKGRVARDLTNRWSMLL